MPIEAVFLEHEQEYYMVCPSCGSAPFRGIFRGLVQRSKRRWGIGRKRSYCAVICDACKNIVGYETPRTFREVIGDAHDPHNFYDHP
jgi:hypothetical protein